MREVEVVVVGGGPSGSVCGSLLKKAGLDCLVVDRASFPRDKICGGGLTPKAWRLLEHLLPGVKYDYRPVTHLKLQFDDEPLCEFESEFELRMTNRKDFDYSLLQYYQAHGGEVLKDAFVRYENQADGRILVVLRSGEQLLCRYLIAADGAHSRIRRQMFGPYEANALFIEQYTEPTGNHEIFAHFSDHYFPGSFYKFPAVGRDVWGFRGPMTDRDHFQERMSKFGVPAGRIVGGYIPMKAVASTQENIMIIGDAGGFPNRITGEGLYDAFKTAYHAQCAIVEHRPFNETNKEVFDKMKREDKLFKFANTTLCRWLFRRVLRHPRLVKALFDAKMKRETWL
jgi:flavin-dependent dehydrogenase